MDEKPASSQDADSRLGIRQSRLLLAAWIGIAAATMIFVFSGAVLFAHMLDLSGSQRDRSLLQEFLQEFFAGANLTNANMQPLGDEVFLSAFDAEMRRINPDYVCWITIEGTPADYPVVRGSDNERYLDTSFFGERNAFGTLFMDYRNAGEHVPHIIIYGHNSRHGNKFGELHKFLDAHHLAMHPTITLRINDRIVEYEIFAARHTDIHDPAYFLDFSAPGSFQTFAERVGAPQGTVQIITLSTCVSGDDIDGRVVVQGALRQSSY
ncbi:MAG: class B sortase [Defluviitaleaceae bacterium]|nr:class B sortase [Defluviitaleaceae bacterium]